MEKIDIWTSSITAAMTTMWSEFAGFAPNAIGAIIILVVGYLVAKLVSMLIGKLFLALGVDRFSAKAGLTGALSQANIETSLSVMLGRIIFWIMMLTFVVSATETLNLPRVSTTINSLVQYLPKVLGAVFMLLVGLFVARFIRDIVRTSSSGIGFEYAKTLSTFCYAMLIVIVVSLAIGQLELETAMLTQAISIVLLSAGGAAAIAFGLGSKDVAANILAGTYVRDTFKENDVVVINDVSVRVKSVGAVVTIMETTSGEIAVPNDVLISTITEKKADSKTTKK